MIDTYSVRNIIWDLVIRYLLVVTGALLVVTMFASNSYILSYSLSAIYGILKTDSFAWLLQVCCKQLLKPESANQIKAFQCRTGFAAKMARSTSRPQAPATSVQTSPSRLVWQIGSMQK